MLVQSKKSIIDMTMIGDPREIPSLTSSTPLVPLVCPRAFLCPKRELCSRPPPSWEESYFFFRKFFRFFSCSRTRLLRKGMEFSLIFLWLMATRPLSNSLSCLVVSESLISVVISLVFWMMSNMQSLPYSLLFLVSWTRSKLVFFKNSLPWAIFNNIWSP